MASEMEDARFEDGGEEALRLLAYDDEDLQVLSTLTQDAVFPASEMSWEAGKRRFSLLLNRFRWEDAQAAKRAGARWNGCNLSCRSRM